MEVAEVKEKYEAVLEENKKLKAKVSIDLVLAGSFTKLNCK